MLTLDEEIMKLDLIASDAFEGGDANEFKQLAEWLRELKKLRTEQKDVYMNGYNEGYEDGYCYALEDSH